MVWNTPAEFKPISLMKNKNGDVRCKQKIWLSFFGSSVRRISRLTNPWIEHSTLIQQWVTKLTLTIRGYLLPVQVTFSKIQPYTSRKKQGPHNQNLLNPPRWAQRIFWEQFYCSLFCSCWYSLFKLWHPHLPAPSHPSPALPGLLQRVQSELPWQPLTIRLLTGKPSLENTLDTRSAPLHKAEITTPKITAACLV